MKSLFLYVFLFFVACSDYKKPVGEVVARVEDEVLTKEMLLFLAGNQGGWGTDEDDFHLYGYDSEYGIGGDAMMGGMARYVVSRDNNVFMKD